MSVVNNDIIRAFLKGVSRMIMRDILLSDLLRAWEQMYLPHLGLGQVPAAVT